MKRFKNILCVIEAGTDGDVLIERAVALAENNQARLTVLSVAENVMAVIGMLDGGPTSADIQTALMNAQADEINTLLAPYRDRVEIETRILTGVPFVEVIRDVLTHGHDLVVKVAKSRDWMERLFGGDDMHLLRKCPCPVWLLKPHAPRSYRRILAAVDVDDAHPPAERESRDALNRTILEISCSLALSDFAELHVAHAWVAIGETAMRGPFMYTPEEKITAYLDGVVEARKNALAQLIDGLAGRLGAEATAYLEPRTHLVKGVPEREIPLLAERLDVDLVVIGTVARTGVPGFVMGNTAELILGQIGCSVLALKPPGFVSPVEAQH